MKNNKCKDCLVEFVKIRNDQIFCSKSCNHAFFKRKSKIDMRALRKLDASYGQKWKKENGERYNLYSLFYHRKYREKYSFDDKGRIKPRIEPLSIRTNSRKDIVINFYTDMKNSQPNPKQVGTQYKVAVKSKNGTKAGSKKTYKK